MEKLKNETLKQDIESKIKSHFTKGIIPKRQQQEFKKDDLKRLNEKEIWIQPRIKLPSDSKRALLYTNTRNVYLIDLEDGFSIYRFKELHPSKLCLEKNKETLFDGDLSIAPVGITFAAYNVYVIQGKNLTLTISSQIEPLRKIPSPIIVQEAQFLFYVIPFHPLQEIQSLSVYNNCLFDTFYLFKPERKKQDSRLWLEPHIKLWREKSTYEFEVCFFSTKDMIETKKCGIMKTDFERFKKLIETKNGNVSYVESIDYFYPSGRYTPIEEKQFIRVQKNLKKRSEIFTSDKTLGIRAQVKDEDTSLVASLPLNEVCLFIRKKKRTQYLMINEGYRYDFTEVYSGSKVSEVLSMKEPSFYEFEIEMIRSKELLEKNDYDISFLFINKALLPLIT